MQDEYQTVRIEEDDLIHITTDHEAKIGAIHYMLCGTSTRIRRAPGDLRDTKRVMTKTNEHPTCPKCAQACLSSLNKIKTCTTSGRVISAAYAKIFGISACRKGKCDELHNSIVKSNHNYPYVPNSCRDIAATLDSIFRIITKKKNITDLHDQPRLRFLDAGCGIGNIVTLAYTVGFVAHGIELNSEYLKLAKKLTVNLYHRPYFECADIITFDRYHKYDLIYYYVPIQDRVLQTAFEVHLIRNMKVGAYMFPTGSNRAVQVARREHYFKEYETDTHNRSIFEKIKEVPKDWVPKSQWLKKEYRKYVASKQKEKGGKS